MRVEEMEALLRKSVGVAVSSIEMRKSIITVIEEMFKSIENPDFGTDALRVCFMLECFEHMKKSGILILWNQRINCWICLGTNLLYQSSLIL